MEPHFVPYRPERLSPAERLVRVRAFRESEILGRPKNERAYLLIPLGHPAPDCRVPDLVRKPLQEVVA